jgi:hypothetical protein
MDESTTLTDFPKLHCPFIEIFGYDRNGRDEIEDQEKFE